jgi:hypothetical protein
MSPNKDVGIFVFRPVRLIIVSMVLTNINKHLPQRYRIRKRISSQFVAVALSFPPDRGSTDMHPAVPPRVDQIVLLNCEILLIKNCSTHHHRVSVRFPTGISYPLVFPSIALNEKSHCPITSEIHFIDVAFSTKINTINRVGYILRPLPSQGVRLGDGSFNTAARCGFRFLSHIERRFRPLKRIPFRRMQEGK